MTNEAEAFNLAKLLSEQGAKILHFPRYLG